MSRLLTPGEIEIAVNKWKNLDWPTRHVRLDRGHYEDILLVIAQAQDTETARIFARLLDAKDAYYQLQIRILTKIHKKEIAKIFKWIEEKPVKAYSTEVGDLNFKIQMTDEYIELKSKYGINNKIKETESGS